MKYTDIEIGMKVIVRPINFATHEQDVTHIWYDKIATVIDIGENPYLEQVCVSMDDFPACNGREYKNRFWYCAEELNAMED